ncbi:MAG TPA: archaetidylserine decarboxylase, partial [Pseudomonadales bacterium]|nr:archaetidylserine decarboxylase [Pseudomonadales bacterium]
MNTLQFSDNTSWKDKLFIVLQYVVPQHLLSRIVGLLAENETPWLKNFLIEKFIRHFRVNMNEAAQPDYKLYHNFNSFFTRELAAGVRTIVADGVACPADGQVSQLGNIEYGRIFQAKGQSYSALELLGGDAELAQKFDDGLFATIYLSPRDYHRVHMPAAGKLLRSIYVPGDLFSVNTTTAENVPRLFSRNERLVAVFDTRYGEMAVVLVGAMIVAGIETVWSGQVAPRQRKIETQDFVSLPNPVQLGKGAEMGRFKLGSTAVVLFRKDCGLRWQVAAG